MMAALFLIVTWPLEISQGLDEIHTYVHLFVSGWGATRYPTSPMGVFLLVVRVMDSPAVSQVGLQEGASYNHSREGNSVGG